MGDGGNDRAELERRLAQARRLAQSSTDPLTKERLEKLVQDLEDQLRPQK
jgi:TATA-binding protein-associated factor Taf7